MWSNSCFLRGVRSRDRKTFITVFVLGFVIVGFLLAYTAFGEESILSTLTQVHIVFRHGEKNPSYLYPTDPHKYKKWPEGFGELTIRGKQQIYNLGKTLRKRYNSFLSNHYSDKEIHMQSSSVARCQMSAQTLLAGLFPPVDSQIWNPNLLWQPIPVNSIPREQDNLIAAKAHCPAFDLEKKNSDREISSETTQADKELFSYLTKLSGKEISNIYDVESLYGVLLIEQENGLELPEWTETVFPEPMKKLAALNLASFTRTLKLKRLQAGPMIGEWLRHMNGESSAKMELYSGHDLTLVRCLQGLGFKELVLPQYGAALVVETHTIHEHQYVKLFYYESSSTKEPRALTISGCDMPCSLETFLAIAGPVVPSNWTEECNTLPPTS